MTDQYLNVSQKLSSTLTRQYSTSFSLGIRLFPVRYQLAIYGIYGFVRMADEIVDTFHDFNKKDLLERFQTETFRAIQEGISTNPILHSFQHVVNQYAIDQALIDSFLHSMRMDLTRKTFTQQQYQEYIYGSAEVVGLMCLQVFCFPDQSRYLQLKKPACYLGSAFQKVNFLRDIGSDLDIRNRIYLPDVKNKEEISGEHKLRIEREIDQEFQEALDGIKKLPASVRLAVFSVYCYYVALFEKLRKHSLEDVVQQRTRISNSHKLWLLLRAFLQEKFQWY